MSDFTTNLQLPYLMPAQAQKHVTVNEALRRLDMLCQATAVSMSTMAQPASPADGAVYILPPGKSGDDWDLAANWCIALYADGVWEFATPREGWLVWVRDEDGLFAWTGLEWAPVNILTSGGLRAAGAAMNDEFADPPHVKAIDQGLCVSAAPRFAGGLRVGDPPAFSGLMLLTQPANGNCFGVYASHASQTADLYSLLVKRAASSGLFFCRFYTNYPASTDTEFAFRTDGQAYADGARNGGGADYAEYFEWADGNPEAEDRRGLPVVIVEAGGGRIRPATAEDDPGAIIGAVSGNPFVVGDAAWNRWTGKYLRDDFGVYLLEDYEAVSWTETGLDGEPAVRSFPSDAVPEDVQPPADAVWTTQQRRILNPDFDGAQAYTPRAERPEWAAVGLMGKLRVRKGQRAGARWIKLRDVSATVEEWLVR